MMEKQGQYRPQFHFSPKQQWINDPNGLVYYAGEYHLFYQYHPESTVWGPMHWGHAVSEDLLHWKELPIALYPDELGAIFSGSIVVDEKNTSGLQKGEEPVFIAIFTHHTDEKETQSIAYSHDKGRTWHKYIDNPVIDNPGLKDFRDPKVFWHEPAKRWIMSLACGDHIQFYASGNLLDWSFLSKFGQEYGAHGGVWECPDLFCLPVAEENKEKWVLIVSVNPGGPNSGSAVQYFTGDFDGQHFVCDDSNDTIKWADFGRDFYAAVTWSNLPKKWWIGWMNNWQYANEVPTHPFRGQMSMPRKMSLIKKKDTYFLKQDPLELPIEEAYKQEEQLELAADHPISLSLPSLQFVLDATIQKSTATSIEFKISSRDDFISIMIDNQQQAISIDRKNSTETTFSSHFPSKDSMPITEVKQLKCIVDRNSIEIFVNNGKKVMTELFFLDQQDISFQCSTSGGKVLFNEFNILGIPSIY
ncbi:glycoside hydrolase family 32 protein [Gracilibacillus sp. YIM 98692]|uniref:glycoside hydrolase family 32 protein n=1 Tax=Gracilibacillus sp. YIM 98692 TaxID=2663532 RepID=UPI0013D24A07|nr:glycoside hydrolase family 32 protein [Gracilibacillus sp. YIM 98692]